MRRRYTKRTSCRKASRKEWQKGQTGKARQVQLTLDAEEVLTMLRDSLTAYATEIGLKLPIQRPRIRYTQRCGEAELENYARLQSPEAMPQSVLKRRVRGVSCRDYVKASAGEVRQLAERRFDGVRFAVIYLDGVQYAGETMICALGITEDGTKRLLGVRQGATENAAVCTALLEDATQSTRPSCPWKGA